MMLAQTTHLSLEVCIEYDVTFNVFIPDKTYKPVHFCVHICVLCNNHYVGSDRGHDDEKGLDICFHDYQCQPEFLCAMGHCRSRKCSSDFDCKQWDYSLQCMERIPAPPGMHTRGYTQKPAQKSCRKPCHDVGSTAGCGVHQICMEFSKNYNEHSSKVSLVCSTPRCHVGAQVRTYIMHHSVCAGNRTIT